MDKNKFIELGQVDKREFDLGEAKIVTIPPKTEEVIIEPSREEQTIFPGENKYIDKVIARAVTSAIDSNITPLNIRKGVSVLGVEGNLEPDKPNQSKVVSPKTSEQVIVADSGYELESVTIGAVTSDIDSNIISGNIRSGVSILGVEGNVEPDKPSQEKNVVPNETEQRVVADDGYKLGAVNVGAIPDEYVVPSGTLNITRNGLHDVKHYESADVNLELNLQEKTATKNGVVIADSGYDALGKVTVDVPDPILERKEITENGTYNASDDGADGYSVVDVNVVFKPEPNGVIKFINGETDRCVDDLGQFYSGLNGMFQSNTRIAYAEFPNLVSINNYMFNGCSNLSEAKFENATYIGASAFYSCRQLSSINMPLVTFISSYAFDGCSQIKSMSFPLVSEVGTLVFNRCSNLSNLYMPNLEAVGRSAFANMSAFSGDVLFSKLSVLKGNNIFSSTPIKTLSLPALTTFGYLSGSKVYGDYLFANMPSVTAIYLDNVVSVYSSITSSMSCPFSGNGKLKYVYAPKLPIIPDYMFMYRGIQSADYPLATSIGIGAFGNCQQLSSINMPMVTTIGSYAFAACYSLSSINFPNCLSIYYFAFSYCSNLVSVSLPAATRVNNAFYMCSKIEELNLPECVNISCSFMSGLKRVNLPKAGINGYMFYSCINLLSVSLNNMINNTNSPFGNCHNLSLIYVSSSSFYTAHLIPSSCFSNCYNLKTLIINYPSVLRLNHSNAFSSTPISNYTASTGGVYGSVYVPDDLVDTYKSSTNWVYFSNRITGISTLPESIKTEYGLN